MGGQLAKRNNYFQSHIESLVESDAVYKNRRSPSQGKGKRDVSQGSVGSQKSQPSAKNKKNNYDEYIANLKRLASRPRKSNSRDRSTRSQRPTFG